MYGFAIAAEIFGSANRGVTEPRYEITAVSEHGGPVRSFNGTSVMSQALSSLTNEPDVLVICSAQPSAFQNTSQHVVSWVRKHIRGGATICVFGSAVWMLARMGELNGRRCSAHWSDLTALKETYRGFTSHQISSRSMRKSVPARGATAWPISCWNWSLNITVSQPPTRCATISY